MSALRLRNLAAAVTILSLNQDYNYGVSAYSTRETKLGPKLRTHLQSADRFEKVVDTDQTP